MKFPEHPFWDFSLRVYGTDGVPPACLSLQERHGLDVNILLFCHWLGAAGFPARDEAQLRTIVDAAQPWHETVVRSLRAIRQRMKQPIEPVDHGLAQKLRSAVQKTEIDAEHLEQLTLASTVSGEKPKSFSKAVQRENARSNVLLYFNALGIAPDGSDEENLAVIAAAAFPEG